MVNTCYHIISNQNSKHLCSYEDTINLASEWNKKGDFNIRVFKIIVTEIEDDAISIDEELIPHDKIFNN